ncbi:MAG: YceI family protein [Acidobacteria bacterium]|nr:YceI family protein [Acidobacteriota bacterium]
MIQLVAIAIALAGFWTPPQQLTGAYDVDYERSTIVAKLKKGGLLRFLAHEHGVVPGEWSAEVVFDPGDSRRSRIVVQIEAASLIIDTPAARELAAVDPDGPNDEDLAKIRAKMLSDEQLDVVAFPAIRFETTRLRLVDDRLELYGELTIHGVTREVDVETQLRLEGDAWVVRGSLTIEQKDFGIEPVSIGGVVKVANAIEITFEIYAVPSR